MIDIMTTSLSSPLRVMTINCQHYNKQIIPTVHLTGDDNSGANRGFSKGQHQCWVPKSVEQNSSCQLNLDDCADILETQIRIFITQDDKTAEPISIPLYVQENSWAIHS